MISCECSVSFDSKYVCKTGRSNMFYFVSAIAKVCVVEGSRKGKMVDSIFLLLKKTKFAVRIFVY